MEKATIHDFQFLALVPTFAHPLSEERFQSQVKQIRKRVVRAQAIHDRVETNHSRLQSPLFNSEGSTGDEWEKI